MPQLHLKMDLIEQIHVHAYVQIYCILSISYLLTDMSCFCSLVTVKSPAMDVLVPAFDFLFSVLLSLC